MGGMPFALGASLLGLALSGAAVAASGASAHIGDLSEAIGPLRQKRGKGQNNRRGKHAARRHGAKLRANRLHTSKRVRAKHRKAANRG